MSHCIHRQPRLSSFSSTDAKLEYRPEHPNDTVRHISEFTSVKYTARLISLRLRVLRVICIRPINAIHSFLVMASYKMTRQANQNSVWPKKFFLSSQSIETWWRTHQLMTKFSNDRQTHSKDDEYNTTINEAMTKHFSKIIIERSSVFGGRNVRECQRKIEKRNWSVIHLCTCAYKNARSVRGNSNFFHFRKSLKTFSSSVASN